MENGIGKNTILYIYILYHFKDTNLCYGLFVIRLGFGPDEDVLFVTFGQTEGSQDVASERLGSSVCMYSMSSIRHNFLRAQKDCYSGTGRILKWINDSEPRCWFDVSMSDTCYIIILLTFLQY